ncbi:glycoside hydrolase family 6 protein [Streptomyces sp. NRRL F-5126]|uniref:glycoside hydrolase family 6 protein n=1 Tax=Streptomyces sp. NRRL F-5126 TaxID=1463857 RepID=UPI0004CAFB6C|nr:glycoside hydrolase family 6 protein [Streptomyces sp. NRRL F-5126]
MPGRPHPRLAALPVSLALALCPAAAACSAGGGDGHASVVGGESAPYSASPYWVDPDSDAARQVKKWQADGRTADAKLLQRISRRPVADWPAGDDPGPEIRHAVRSAAPAGRTVLLVAYNIPHRDCGKYSAGGATSAQAYQSWINAFAGAIGDAPALVVLEPDALPHLADGCTPPEFQQERYTLLSAAVTRLKQQPHTKVYLDAGNPAWVADTGRMADALKRAGVARADGFSLNVSNFQRDDAVKRYGARISGALGGAHFVMDTSRNGAGPLPGGRGDEAWCNPPGRALGKAPSTHTGDPLLDAYLWIKRPGDSDGTCRGGPAAGSWWPQYALGLARRAKS